MDERFEDLRSTKNPKARIKILKGHFATSHSHINTYIDMSTVKVRHNNCRETAKVLASEYVSTTMVDTIGKYIQKKVLTRIIFSIKESIRS